MAAGMSKEEHLHHESKEIAPGAPVAEVLDFSDGLTRERNEAYFPTLDKRILHLYDGGVELIDTARAKEKDGKFIPIVASKILLRTINTLQALSFDSKEIVKKLIEKYPEGGCSYCGKKPCECGVIRAEDKVGAVSSPEQEKWSIAQWQKHLNSVYGATNTARGVEFATGRVSSEMKELKDAVLLMEKNANAPEKAEMYRQEAASEAADVFAWAIGVCNVADEDLEKAFMERYGKGCPNCGQYPCKCGEFTGKQERKALRAL